MKPQSTQVMMTEVARSTLGKLDEHVEQRDKAEVEWLQAVVARCVHVSSTFRPLLCLYLQAPLADPCINILLTSRG